MFEHVPPISEVDVLTSPDAVAAELARSLPRGEDVSALLMLDPEALSDAGRVDLLVAFERHLALLQAAQQQVLAALDGQALDWSSTKLINYTREQVGATDPANVAALCQRHHNAGWHVTHQPDGTSIWTSPTGHTYARPPDG
jgi:hypothetical protein